MTIMPFSELRERIAEQLKIAIKIQDFNIIQAELDENEWKINIEYMEEGSLLFMTDCALKVDAETGNLKGIWKGQHWE